MHNIEGLLQQTGAHAVPEVKSVTKSGINDFITMTTNSVII